MILISHRGNIEGPNPERENSPNYIIEAIELGYNVEVDIWILNEKIFLGHDKPQYVVSQKWIEERVDKLWIHCKNIESLQFFNKFNQFNYFWHQEDIATLTSKNYMWIYPGNQPVLNSIAVMPEMYNDNLNMCIGICSDYIMNYKK